MVVNFKLKQGNQIQKIAADLDKVPDTVISKVFGLVSGTIRKIRRDTEKSMRGPKTGEWYVYQGSRYQASAPGETPAIRSGALLRSINSFTRRTAFGVKGVVRTNIFYAKFLVRKDRPIFKPALDANKAAFFTAIRKVAKEVGN